MSSHPVSKPRWAALKDDEHWVPMRGVVSRIARAFSCHPEIAGGLIAEGMANGTIAHKPVADSDQGWIVSPQAAEMLKLGGFCYETGLDWGSGCIRLYPDAPRVPWAVYWPDVEDAQRNATLTSTRQSNKPTQHMVNDWMMAYFQRAKDQGKPPPKRDEQAFADCQTATGATDAQMRLAMRAVPLNQRRARGQKG